MAVSGEIPLQKYIVELHRLFPDLESHPSLDSVFRVFGRFKSDSLFASFNPIPPPNPRSHPLCARTQDHIPFCRHLAAVNPRNLVTLLDAVQAATNESLVMRDELSLPESKDEAGECGPEKEHGDKYKDKAMGRDYDYRSAANKEAMRSNTTRPPINKMVQNELENMNIGDLRVNEERIRTGNINFSGICAAITIAHARAMTFLIPDHSYPSASRYSTTTSDYSRTHKIYHQHRISPRRGPNHQSDATASEIPFAWGWGAMPKINEKVLVKDIRSRFDGEAKKILDNGLSCYGDVGLDFLLNAYKVLENTIVKTPDGLGMRGRIRGWRRRVFYRKAYRVCRYRARRRRNIFLHRAGLTADA